MTFGFWYRLAEDLYHAHDESLNQTFRSYTQRLIIALYKHCQIEPDHVSNQKCFKRSYWDVSIV